MTSDACANLPLLGTKVDLQYQQFVGIRVRLRGFDGRNFEFNLAEFIDRNHIPSL
jgi:hypothetical protein